MADLYGIDCTAPNCFHDTSKGYRLRFKTRRDRYCVLCKREGLKLEDAKDPLGKVHRNRLQCATCRETNGQPLRWNTNWINERRDMMFRNTELLVAQAQMKMLGCEREVLPNTAHQIEEHHTLRKGYDARLLILTEEPMPKCAVYFRWNPTAGEVLTPELVFQMQFSPTMTAAERRNAPGLSLTEGQFMEVRQYCTYETGDTLTQGVETYTSLRCQHCHHPISARAFSTQSLREVLLGD